MANVSSQDREVSVPEQRGQEKTSRCRAACPFCLPPPQRLGVSHELPPKPFLETFWRGLRGAKHPFRFEKYPKACRAQIHDREAVLDGTPCRAIDVRQNS